LMYFFTKNGKELPLSNKGSDYKPGDIVCWDLGAGILHIGIVLNRLSADGERPLVMHNIGGGQVAEDILFAYDLIGHYRYPFP
jgi:uncharacterized protein YijF (DUF1287 family)